MLKDKGSGGGICAAACLIALLLVNGVCAANAEQSARRYDLHIVHETLGEALTALSRQARVSLLYPYDLADSTGIKPVSGRYTVREALDLMLLDTDFSGGLTEGGVITVSLDKSKKRNREGKVENGKSGKKGNALLAGVAAFLFGANAVAQDTGAVSDPSPDEDGSDVIDTVVVIGTRIRGAESVAPSVSFDREDFDRAGFSTVEQLFESLPQNLGEISATGRFSIGSSRIAGSNTDATSGVSLRGLGPESTLTLINGRRSPGGISGRVVDISAIPLAAIERVDVITGGASALYGSDAVAGVVNLVTRNEFDGVELQAYGGIGHDGGERAQASVVAGKAFDRGGFVVAYDYTRDFSLDATDAGVAGDGPVLLPGFPPLSPVPGRFFLHPDNQRHSAFLSGNVDISDAVHLYGHGLFTANETQDLTETNFSIQNIDSSGDTVQGTVGLLAALARDWTLDVAGTYGERDSGSTATTLLGLSAAREVSRISQISATVNGKLFTVGSIDVLAAFGGERRTEVYRDIDVTADTVRFDEERTIWSAFGEIRIPLVENGDAPGLHRLELSAAARYDNYSDFGGNVEPQVGVIWSPTEHWTVRGSYASAFRVPALFLGGFAPVSTQASLQFITDPSSPVGASPTLFLFGTSQALKPEEARTFTASIDYEPSYVDNTTLSISFFDISYDDRIDDPVQVLDRFGVLQNEDVFAPLITRMPTEAEARAFFDQAVGARGPGAFLNLTGVPFDPLTQNFTDVFPDLVLFDNQRTNISSEDVRGLDFQINTLMPTDIGDFSFGFTGTYYIDFERRATPTAPVTSQINRPGRPPDFRFRTNVGWQDGPWTVTTFVNYVDGYQDTLATTPTRIASYTTVDVSLRFEAGRLFQRAAFDGFSATLSVENLFNERPPFFDNNPFGLKFDPANADALGRFIALRLVNRW